MSKKLSLSYKDKVFLGVCGGLASYFELPPILVRILFIGLIAIGMGLPLFVYLFLYVFMKSG